MPAKLLAFASVLAQPIFELSLFVLLPAIVVAFALLVYSVARFRRSREDDRLAHPQAYENNQVGLAWTVIPILIVVTLFWQQGE